MCKSKCENVTNPIKKKHCLEHFNICITCDALETPEEKLECYKRTPVTMTSTNHEECCGLWEKRHPEGNADYFLIKQAYTPALLLGQSTKATPIF